MRIITYNILDGGEGRADPIAEVIAAQQADIVCLVEADNADVLERISRRLSMDHVQAWGEKHAVAPLSRWPIVESSNIAGWRARQGEALSEPGLLATPGSAGASPSRVRCFLKALVAGPNGMQWPIGVVHFKGGALDADETMREQELAVVLEAFAAERAAGRPHLLAGDFNANSPVQQIDLAKCSPKTAREAQANGGTIPRRVVQKILDAGYRDAVGDRVRPMTAKLSVGPMPPSALGALGMADGGIGPTGIGRTCVGQTAGSFTTQHPEQRVDYVFTFGIDAGRILEARVEHDRLAKYASDHFPVVVGVA